MNVQKKGNLKLRDGHNYLSLSIYVYKTKEKKYSCNGYGWESIKDKFEI